MPIRKTPLVTGEYYHIFNRGVNKQPIFFDKIEYKRTLNMLQFYSNKDLPLKYSKFLQLNVTQRAKLILEMENKNSKIVRIVCACLMPNHFHLLIQQLEDGGIIKFMSNIQNSLTKHINTKHERTGHLLQGEFKSVHVEDDTQLLHLSRYIHLNPYTSYVVKDISELETYEWSSYPEYINSSTNDSYDKDIILSQFKGKEEYRQFVTDQADYQRELDRIKHLLLDD